MIKAVFFDVDNTLISFDEAVRSAMKSGFERFHLGEYREEMFPIFTRMNNELWAALEREEITFEDIQASRWNAIFEAIGIVGDGVHFEGYFRDYLFESAICIDGALELLHALHGRYILCVASNGPYEQQKNRLRLSGMLPCFDYLFVSEEIGHSKPSEAFFDVCLRRLNAGREEPIRPEEILMVGDSLTSDMSGGIRMGMHTCFYNPDGRAVPEGMALDYEVRSLREIAQILS